MRTFILSCMLLLAAGSASAGVTGFDDHAAGEDVIVANGYQGFSWDNVGVIGADAYPGSGYAAGVVSPSNVAYNRDGGTAAISRAGGFHFVGAWFTSAWFDQELAFEGWRDGQLRYASSVSWVIDTMTARWIGLDWAGIDTLVIYNSSGTQWAMDDVTVPEPGSLALLGACAAALGLTRRRRVIQPVF